MNRECINCKGSTVKGFYCQRCDAGIYARMAFESMDEDPVKRAKLLDSIDRSHCSHASGLLKHSQHTGEKPIERAALRIQTYLHKFDFETQCELFSAAFVSARMRTDAEILDRSRGHSVSGAQMIAEIMPDNEFL